MVDGADDQSDLEDELLFEPFDINNDGSIVKTASRCSAASWKRPEPGYDVVITVHRFCELVRKTGADAAQEKANDDGAKVATREVKPNLQLQLKLREGDEENAFSQVSA